MKSRKEYKLIRQWIKECCGLLEQPIIAKYVKLRRKNELGYIGEDAVVAYAALKDFTVFISNGWFKKLSNENKKEAIFHEVCHLLNFAGGHGTNWKKLMRKCGYKKAGPFLDWK